MLPPTLARARRLANVEMLTIELQIRRLRTSEPEDKHFVLRWWADMQFLIVALTRIRRAAAIANDEPAINAACERFDGQLRGLRTLRNVGEHMDDYARNSTARRNDRDANLLEVGTWADPVFAWLGENLNIETARTASSDLLKALSEAHDNKELK